MLITHSSQPVKPGSLNTALLVRDSAEEIHGIGEYCKYEHVRQAIAKANP